jgi:hypothetical protein
VRREKVVMQRCMQRWAPAKRQLVWDLRDRLELQGARRGELLIGDKPCKSRNVAVRDKVLGGWAHEMKFSTLFWAVDGETLTAMKKQ